MKTLYALLLSLTLSVPALAGSGSGNVSSVIQSASTDQSQSGTTYPLFQPSDPTTPVYTVVAGDMNTNAVGASFYPFYAPGGAGFHTGINKKAYCFSAMGGSTVAWLSFQFVTSTVAITFGQSTALTNPTYTGGATAKYPLNTGNSAANAKGRVPGIYIFGDGVNDTYVGIQTFSSAQTIAVQMDCYTK